MRLWHKDLIPYLPRQQLLGQWRECCLIAKTIREDGTPNHILVNRIMDYPRAHFLRYCRMVYFEMSRRRYSADIKRLAQYVDDIHAGWNMPTADLFPDWHNDRYFAQCMMNLQEKYDCGGIPPVEWQKIAERWPEYE